MTQGIRRVAYLCSAVVLLAASLAESSARAGHPDSQPPGSPGQALISPVDVIVRFEPELKSVHGRPSLRSSSGPVLSLR